MKKPDKRKFVIIAKVDSDKFVKYRTNDFNNCLDFIRKKFGDIYYANIFCNKGESKGKMLYTFGKHKGLIAA